MKVGNHNNGNVKRRRKASRIVATWIKDNVEIWNEEEGNVRESGIEIGEHC